MIGGLMYLSGTLIMTYNLWRTAHMPSVAMSETEASRPAPAAALAAE
jgi:cytochrome c oxidase cbb3-type subunit 1